jgi:osmotically-inducible protein OsmY
MIKSKLYMLASAVLLLAGSLSAYADDQSSAADVSQDAMVTAAVEQAIAQHPDLGAPNQIYVGTRNHVVYLSGIVDYGLVTEDAEQVARQVPGVVRVVNSISIDK